MDTLAINPLVMEALQSMPVFNRATRRAAQAKRGVFKRLKLDMRSACGYRAPRKGMRWDNDLARSGQYVEASRLSQGEQQ